LIKKGNISALVYSSAIMLLDNKDNEEVVRVKESKINITSVSMYLV
jgi:hypothetical protein